MDFFDLQMSASVFFTTYNCKYPGITECILGDVRATFTQVSACFDIILNATLLLCVYATNTVHNAYMLVQLQWQYFVSIAFAFSWLDSAIYLQTMAKLIAMPVLSYRNYCCIPCYMKNRKQVFVLRVVIISICVSKLVLDWFNLMQQVRSFSFYCIW